MAKIRTVGSSSEEDGFLKKIQSLGLIQIEEEISRAVKEDLGDYKIDGGKEKDIEKTLNEIRHAENFLEKYSVPKSFLESVVGGKLVLKTRELLEIVGDFDYKTVVERSKILEEAASDLKEREEKTKENMALFETWTQLDKPVEEIRDGTSCEITAGWIPAKFENPDISPGVCQIIQKNAKSCSIVALWLREDREQASKKLKEMEFEKTDFGGFRGKPANIVKGLEDNLAQIEKEKTGFFDESKKLVTQIESLRIVHDYYQNLENLKKAKQSLFHTRHAFVLEGWIKRSDMQTLANASSEFSSVTVEEIDPQDSENPPVALKNRKLFKPFELVIQLYGMPSSKSIDPTVLLSPWFVLFFALCLTDAAYGLIISAFSLVAMTKMKNSKLLWMLFWGGLATVAAGILTGGVFGDLLREGDQAYVKIPALTGFFGKLVWFNPMDPNPLPGSSSPQAMIFFRIALLLGIVQIYFGMIIGFVSFWKDKKKISALLDYGVWLVLLSSLITALFSSQMCIDLNLFEGKSSPLPAGTALPALSVAGVMALLVLFFGARDEKNWGFRIFFGFLKLIVLSGIFSYMGDVMSYVRLMALGMVSAGIGIAVNTVAFMIAGLKVPVLNWVLFAVIFLGGHIFNLAISALGAFVHTLRLQYVEFFSKFFEGGGKEFKPFSTSGKFIVLRD